MHAIVFSRFKRNGKDHVLTLPAGDGNVFLHPGINALPAELWKLARDGERAKALLASKEIEERAPVTVKVIDETPAATSPAPHKE